ncbi:hypothetical protein Tco_0777168, partial [Tanacetum coccineum]
MRSRREKRLKGQDEDEEGSREGEELKHRAWSLYWSWMAAETPRGFRAVGQLI